VRTLNFTYRPFIYTFGVHINNKELCHLHSGINFTKTDNKMCLQKSLILLCN
jgi:hypothetical protein